MQDQARNMGRRDWLMRTLFGGMVATVGVLMYPVMKYLQPKTGASFRAAEMVAPYTADQLRLDADGNWPNAFNFGGKPCLLIKTKVGEIKAFNAVCTHIDCTVAFRPDRSDIFCNCHNGVYDLAGHNVSGPPPRPLEEYNVTLRGTPGQEEILVSRKT